MHLLIFSSVQITFNPLPYQHQLVVYTQILQRTIPDKCNLGVVEYAIGSCAIQSEHHILVVVL